MLVLGLSGSLRRGSHNGTLLRAAAAELPEGDRFEVFGRLAEIPPYNEDDDGGAAPESVAALRAAIAAADVVLIATPEYNGSVPGQLKNALDWASRPFPDSSLRGKPVAVVGASTGLFGALWAQAEVRKVLSTIGARVLGRELPVGQAHQAFDADGRLVNDGQRSALAELVAELRRMTSAASHVGAAV
ncbi:MAG: NAD(P)H-dependent oxidoreductase [Actinomycetota bacterium]|nr:NAD(P)H-dependent oxidoreductase [Actinomycetota bacterium]